MLDQIAAAFQDRNYHRVVQLLRALKQQDPENPWVQFYTGRLYEASGRAKMAETIYRQLLRQVESPKLVSQARQGLQRFETLEAERRQQAIDRAMADPDQGQLGLLVIEPIAVSARSRVAEQLARILRLDRYTARLLLPTRGWRPLRTGRIGELQVYGRELQAAGVQSFWVSLAAIERIRVFQVQFFQSLAPTATVIYRDEIGQRGELTFPWSEIARRVEGQLPLFEQVVDLDARGKLKRKEQTQDFAHLYDLHLPDRRCILRLCDRNYQFSKTLTDGKTRALEEEHQLLTVRSQWNDLLDQLDQQLSQAPTYSDFTAFAEIAREQIGIINHLEPHIQLLRRQESSWDTAFHLYSALAFLRSQATQSDDPAAPTVNL